MQGCPPAALQGRHAGSMELAQQAPLELCSQPCGLLPPLAGAGAAALWGDAGAPPGAGRAAAPGAAAQPAAQHRGAVQPYRIPVGTVRRHHRCVLDRVAARPPGTLPHFLHIGWVQAPQAAIATCPRPEESRPPSLHCTSDVAFRSCLLQAKARAATRSLAGQRCWRFWQRTSNYGTSAHAGCVSLSVRVERRQLCTSSSCGWLIWYVVYS